MIVLFNCGKIKSLLLKISFTDKAHMVWSLQILKYIFVISKRAKIVYDAIVEHYVLFYFILSQKWCRCSVGTEIFKNLSCFVFEVWNSVLILFQKIVYTISVNLSLHFQAVSLKPRLGKNSQFTTICLYLLFKWAYPLLRGFALLQMY